MNKLFNKKLLNILVIVVLILTITGCKDKDKFASTTSTFVKEPETNNTLSGDKESNIPKEKTSDKQTNDTQDTEKDISNKDNMEEKKEDDHEGETINSLTGLWISEEAANRRPVGIMINNLRDAMPQSGVAQADIIYETLVEGEITRLFAIYRDFDAKKIGPVRSARHYYLDFAFDHDSIYAHYGQSEYARRKFTEWNSPHINGLSWLDTIMTYQDPSRERPHSTYTSYEKLMKTWDKVGYRKTNKENFNAKLKFADEEFDIDSNLDAPLVQLSYFSRNKNPWFEYNKDDKLYYRFQFGDKQIDRETGEQLKFKNIIIQFASIWQIKGDKLGCRDMSLITSGNGYYITNGKAQKITWKKPSHYKPTLYFNEDGEEIKLNKGKTWICVNPKSRKDKIKFTK
ncbi:MAG: DUF3048 domain-containing protein [Vallitalea sp.]|jgi:hypothetical protein|nr:DUF3048 domain-containing protein [Vallitalea sp.]